MLHPLRLAAAGLLAVLIPAVATTPAAHAGTYSLTTNTRSVIDGWALTSDPSFFGCSVTSHPGPCADSDVPSPTPLRILGKGSVATGDNARWYWVAPPTVSIDSARVSVTYAAGADTLVYFKSRLRSQTFDHVNRTHSARGSGTETWSVPAGMEALGVFLEASSGANLSDKWANTIRVDTFTATLRDDTPPTASLSGSLAGGAWLRGSQPVCLHVSAADEGAGVSSAAIVDGTQAVLDSDQVAKQSGRQPGRPDYDGTLCLTPSALGDGAHPYVVRVADGAGEMTEIPFTVHVDTTAPTAADLAPASPTTDRRAPVSFSVDPGPSGLASFGATVDGVPMTVTGSRASYLPAADLAYGSHLVQWSATDVAGNVRDGFWTFAVADDSPPQLTDAVPADGWSSEIRRPAIGFHVSDAGTGIDPTTLHVILDGTDVAAVGSFTAGVFSYTPAVDLGFGTHSVRVSVSDLSGNPMTPAAWLFGVVDVTAPAIGDIRPDDGSSSSDRTPTIGFAVTDAGTGVDPASLQVTLDGQDITTRGQLAGGRFGYTPAAPLGYGTHVLTARAADRAGNVSDVARWSFEVRDETAPVVTGRLPADGSTVPGAVTIGFDVSDAGIGLDSASLHVLVDGSDVTSWGDLSAGRFRYSPGNLGAGVHTISVTAADRSGNQVGPVTWEFEVANPATLRIGFEPAPASIVSGQKAFLSVRATSNGVALAGSEVRISLRVAGQPTYGPARLMTTSATGEIRWQIAPGRNTSYRVELAADPSVAAAHTVVVRQHTTLVASHGRIGHGHPLVLAGSVRPAHAGGIVHLQLLTARGWLTVASPRLSRASGFRATVVPRVRGTYVFRALTSATSANAAGESGTVTVHVT